MSYNARLRSQQRRASGLTGDNRGWLPGTSQASQVGIPSHLVNKIRIRTNTLTNKENINNIAGGEVAIPTEYICNNTMLMDTKCLVINQNQLGGIGRIIKYVNQPSTNKIKQVRYFLPFNDKKDCSCMQRSCILCI